MMGMLYVKLRLYLNKFMQATVVSDIFVLYVLRQRAYYRKKKYQNVEGGASFFRDDTVIVDPKEAPTERDPLLGSHTDGETDGEMTDDGSTSVNKKKGNQHKKYS